MKNLPKSSSGDGSEEWVDLDCVMILLMVRSGQLLARSAFLKYSSSLSLLSSVFGSVRAR